MDTNHYTLMFDGGSRGNPGLCGSGFVIYKDEISMWQGCKKVSDKNTNNFAEYMGLILGLAFAIDKGIEYLHVKGDSLLVINQLLGKWKVNSKNIEPLFKQAKKLVSTFKVITFNHVKREQNKVADMLANKAMDEDSS